MVDRQLVSMASFPSDGMVADGGIARPLRHEDRSLGLLAVEKGAGEGLSASESDLLDHIAAGLSLVLRNDQLTASLRQRVDLLESSRARLVAAQDDVRRDIEIQLREGPQATLVGILDELDRLAEETEAERTRSVLASVRTAVDGALRSVGEFATGVFPTVLASAGLGGALRSRAETTPIPVTVHADVVSRLSPDVEAAVYFTASEALQNTTKYACASSAHVVVRESDDGLVLEVTDDGVGFDPDAVTTGAGTTNMVERIDAVGGRLEVRSAPGRGTTVRAHVPLGRHHSATPYPATP
jgi:signal transduction histidine kinase